jgi:cAMP-dependent protein kinase regulator
VAARTAAAGDVVTAAAQWRRLVFHEPGNPSWRLRVLATGTRAGLDAEALEMTALQLVDAALISGRPLVALTAALGVDGTDPAALLSDYLAGSTRLGKTLRSAPPLLRAEDGPVPELTSEAPPPDAPEHPVVGPLPPMPLLSLLDAFALRALLPHVAHRSLDAGEVLMAEGQPADALYLVVHGVLEITKDDPDRPTFTLGRVADGAVLGEMALVLDRPRTATVTALSEVEVLRLDVAGLRAVAAQVPAVEAALAEFTRQRLVQMLIATSPLFRDLEPAARAALLEVFTVRDLPAGVVVTKQGGEGKALRVVISGGVEVWRSEPDEAGGETAPARIATLGPGQVFGEIALLTGQPATATVRTIAPTAVLELTRPVLDGLTARFPGITERLMQIGEARIAEMRFIFQDDDFFEEAD